VFLDGVSYGRDDPASAQVVRELSELGVDSIHIREGVERIELEILARIPEKDLNQAAATLLVLKETLLEKIGEDAAGDADSEDGIEAAANE